MQQLIETDWPKGWIPSNHEHGSFTANSPLGLLRMDNLTLEEQGTLRISKGTSEESTTTFSNVQSLYSTTVDITALGKVKTRYVFSSDGTLSRNYGAGAALKVFDKTIFSGAASNELCRFITALGHTFAIVTSTKYKDRGDVQHALGIAAPTLPTITVNAPSSLSIDNKDGSLNYTNWSSVETSSYDDTSTYVTFAPNTTTNRGLVQTIFSGTLDMTNLGGTGKDTPQDLFKFNFFITDPTILVWLRIEFLCETPTGSTTVPDVQNYFWHEWDMQASSGPYKFFPITGNAWAPVSIKREEFFRVGNDDSKGWQNIKAIRVSIGSLSPVNVAFNDMVFQGGDTGNLTGEFQYVVEQARDTGNYKEYSLHSAESSVITAQNASIHFAAPAALNSQANEWRVYRRDLSTGEYLLVHSETGADGFTPAAFDDNVTTDDAISLAAIDPYRVLEYYRAALPDNIIGMIWFQDRMLYLTTNGFIPSFRFDPGSYDTRYIYNMSGSSSEYCLFIAKIDVGSFIIATNKDFYKVTGSFSKIDNNGIILLDVNIYSMGISDPAISQYFIEVGNSIMYRSATGLRVLSNTESTLINGPLDLLFRNETRYTIPPIITSTSDTGPCVTSGNRIYWSLPHSDGYNRVYILNYDPVDPETRYWRLWTMPSVADNPRCFCREDDGMILFGGVNDYIRGMESAYSTLPVFLETLYNFDGRPNNRKDPLGFVANINTGGQSFVIKIWGLQNDGSEVAYTETISAATDTLFDFDLMGTISSPVAFAVQCYGSSNYFKFDYFIITYEPRPSPVRRIILPATNFGKPNKKKIAALPFVVNPLGGNITVGVKADGVTRPNQIVTADTIRTLMWRNQQDFFACDWEIELSSLTGFEFYKWLPPEILQILPQGKLIDQLGPLDFNAQGIVYGMRLRLMTEASSVTYSVYDSDSLVYSNSISTSTNIDETYIEQFPKGVNSSVCRVILTSSLPLYRFSGEFKVRTTGKESDEKYIKLKDPSSIN